MLADKPLKQVLDDFASSAPTPGGGSAAALAGALGASLLAMVAALPKTKNNTPEDRQALDVARTDMLRARDELVALIDRDAAAYDQVVAAYRHPKGTDDEKAARTAAIQRALQTATEVPVETVRACASAVNAGRSVVAHGNPSARSDIAVAIQTLMVAVQGAMFNVEANIGGLKDPAVVEQITADLRTLQHTMGESGAAIFKDSGLMDLYMQMAKRLGGPHGHGEAGTEASTKRLALGVAAALRQLGSPAAREALEALSRSAEASVAEAAKAGLEKFGASPAT